MTPNRLAQIIARALMGVGLGVGALAVAVWMFNITIDVPAWMWRVAVVKLGLVAGLGLLGAGAVLLRYLRRTQDRANAQFAGRSPNESLPLPNWPSTGAPKEKAAKKETTQRRGTP
jgi:hypothetical protein